MRPSGVRGLERDVDEKLMQMRLRLLEEKLRAEKRAAAGGRRLAGTGAAALDSSRSAAAAAAAAANEDNDDGGDDRIDAEIELARIRHAELRDLLDRERRLAERLANDGGRRQADAQRRERRSPRRDRFDEMMEMMVMQNSQMHNLMLNQVLARQSQPPPLPPLPPPPPPPPPPQFSMFLPMAGSEALFLQQQQQQLGAQRDYIRREPTPKPVATPKEPTPRTKEEGAKPMPLEEPGDEGDQKVFPFPGNRSQQKLRRLAYTAFFIASLNRLTTENKFRPRLDFLFDVRLKEMLETLHRIYKTPEGHLYSVTFATVMGEEAMELTELMNIPKTLTKDEERIVTQEVAYCIENTVFQITDIMPTKGILGTHRKSGIFEMIRSGNLFPRGYFYEMEKDMMEFDEEGRTVNVSDCDSRMLITGLFLVRALIETLYLKTEHYGMVVETTAKAARNIKLMATLLMYIYRKLVGQLAVMNQGTKKARISIPDLPSALSSVMHTDQEIRPVLKLVKKSLDYAINLLIHWSEEYVKRLRDAAFM